MGYIHSKAKGTCHCLGSSSSYCIAIAMYNCEMSFVHRLIGMFSGYSCEPCSFAEGKQSRS